MAKNCPRFHLWQSEIIQLRLPGVPVGLDQDFPDPDILADLGHTCEWHNDYIVYKTSDKACSIVSPARRMETLEEIIFVLQIHITISGKFLLMKI